MSITVFIGILLLIGIVVNNAIVLVDYTNILRARGLDINEAAIEAGKKRLRPVLMTSFAAALGMLPLAYGIGAGADMLKPLAIAVIGALCISVLLSLVATPNVYDILRRAAEKKRDRSR